ncbi:MucR family transcriptional regulator [Lichenibacterium dinghuense]|uniref:MucR family transcriptional regulator n=1 Tax=Lichenibacterium dinghuense TaxID=2895977 RepID=UPI001F1BB650|nr:MucR family transcriptional regulator [Lichenibacterium sp. 6Y81]
MTEEPATSPDFTETTSEIIAAYVSKNSVPAADLPDLIRSVHDTLSSLGKPEQLPVPVELKPAVPIRKSVTEDYIVSLEDGRKFKSMRRYLAGLGMTPDEYRAKWGLPRDYPMIAPAYAKARSEMARGMGFGRKRVGAIAPAPAVEQPALQPEPEAPKKRGRAKKAA